MDIAAYANHLHWLNPRFRCIYDFCRFGWLWLTIEIGWANRQDDHDRKQSRVKAKQVPLSAATWSENYLYSNLCSFCCCYEEKHK